MENNITDKLAIISKELNESIEIVMFENQNEEYGGALIKVSGILTRYRFAKVTPKKSGLFVAFWEKDFQNKNKPYDLNDSPKYLLIEVEEGENKGIFLFDQTVLETKGIYSTDKRKGKMAMRVYPEWSHDLNKQATQTQKWQLNYFNSFTIK
ncbi:MepB family protein [Vagococcus sp. PNs007]|uniref:MepB family protein n=1 Tax=Vagococcus proximus TaxID=2991417 RepID=A0ABT5X3X0_9ENTE|nr:MepB family protein [Vagococcus proximus]MDF0480658.1 MepB family protein [Vagococcus proximus]